MGRIARSHKLDTVAARKRLKPRTKPYTISVAPKRMLGYVRMEHGAGRWLAIIEVGRTETKSAKRRQGFIGLADDLAKADNVNVLSFTTAMATAAAWEPDEAARNAMTVRKAIRA